MSRALKWFSAACLLFAVGGCASSGTINIDQPKSRSIETRKVVSLDVIAGPEAEDQKAADMLSVDLYGRLVASGLFRQVVQPAESGDYRLEVRLAGVEEVSQAARIGLGVLAGSNSVAASVWLYDSRTGELITAFDVTGESASHPMSSESGFDDAVREAAVKIVDGLR